VLEIEQVTTRAAADRWHEVEAASALVDYIEMPAGSVREVYERIEGTRTDALDELWLGTVGVHAVALAALSLPMLDNLMNAAVEIGVHPAFRRQGHGRSMLDHVAARAKAHGRSRLIGEACEPVSSREGESSPGSAFARAMGARPVTAEIRRMLKIANIDTTRLRELHDDAVAKSRGYSLVQWEGSAPEDLLDDLAFLQSRMTTDAPLEDLDWEPEAWTRDRYREQERNAAASGRTRLVTVARHESSGRIVAFTDIAIGAEPPEIAYQWATIVQADHRGHRLGMLIKLANLRFLQDTHPRVEMLNTWNAGVNDHMVAINDAIGFRSVERWREWQIELG
jgi:GNAT superfamily N-acetyltransferase